MKIVCQLSRSRIVEGVGCELDLLVRLRAPAAPKDASRPPLCVVPVVDVSGSMAGAKIAAVRHALERLVEHLLPGDHFGLVTFDSHATVQLPIVEVTEARKADARAIIAKLHGGSGTNMAGGLLASAELVGAARARLPAAIEPRLVLLTDGCANEGVATTAEALVALARAALADATLSAFGYGEDCDHALLDALSDEGGGTFAFIANEDAVLTAFARELGGLVATYASNVQLRVVPHAGAPIAADVGTLLFYGEGRRVFGIAVAAHGRASGVELGAVEVTWIDQRAHSQKARVPILVDYVARGAEDTADDAAVARARDEEELRQAQEAAERIARAGDFRGARKRLEAVALRLRDEGLQRFLAEVLLPCYVDQAEYAASSSLRTSAGAALKRKRQAASDARVADAFDVGPTAMEAEVEKSFRARKAKKTPTP